MRRTGSFLAVFFCLCVLAPWAAAQEADDEDEGEAVISSDWNTYVPPVYSFGDKAFVITMGLVFPSFFWGDAVEDNSMDMSLGGTGSLSYLFFLGPHLYAGAEIGGMFARTRAKNMYYAVPFGLSIGYQFVLQRFEFPLSLTVGGAPQSYLDYNHFGLFLKGGVSAFFRFNADWSFGLNGKWWFLPQWPKNGNTVYGNFLELTLSARFHF